MADHADKKRALMLSQPAHHLRMQLTELPGAGGRMRLPGSLRLCELRAGGNPHKEHQAPEEPSYPFRSVQKPEDKVVGSAHMWAHFTWNPETRSTFNSDGRSMLLNKGE